MNEVEFVVKGIDKSDAAFDSAESKAEGFGGKLSGVFAKMGPLLAAGAAAAGAVAGAALMKAVTGAIEKEDTIAALEASLTPEDAEGAGEAAGRAFKAGFAPSMAEAADAVGAVKGSLGDLAEGKELDEAVRNALNFAKVFKVDVAESASLAQNLIKNGLAKDATEAFDLMTSAAQKVPPALRGEIVEAADEYGQFFNQLGLKGPAAFDLLVRGAEKGQYGIDKAGDAIKEFTIKATDGSKTTSDAFNTLGLDMGKMSNDLLVGGEKANTAFNTIIDKLLSIKDPSKQAQTALALFGAPLEDLSTAEIPDFLKSMDDLGKGMEDAGGSADKMNEKLDTNARKIQSFKNRATDALTNFGGEAIAAFEKIANSPEMQRFIEVLQEEVLPVIEKFGNWIKEKVLPVVKELAEDRLSALQESLDKIRSAIKENEPELKQLGKFLKEIAEFIIEKVVPAFGSFINFLIKDAARGVSRFINLIGDMIDAYNKIKRTVTSVVDWVKDKWDDSISFFQKLPGRASRAFRGMFDGIKDAFKSAMNWVIERWNNFSIPGVDTPFGTLGGFNTPNIKYFASGGVSSGGLSMVGERGRELLKLPGGTQVMSNPDTERLMASGGGSRVTVEVGIRSGVSDKLADLLVELLSFKVRTEGGGDVQALLGSGT